MLNPYLIGAIGAVILFGASGIAHGIKWTVSHAPCIVRHGVRGCKAKPVVAPVVAK